jgi:DNA-binding NarL/FixJ family response regulator
MFVDDDMMLLASTRRQLLTKLSSFELVFCSAGKQAIMEASKRPPAIIFSDVRMPEMDGPELLKEFSESFPDTIRFALTGQSYEEQLDRTCAVAHQVFSKPFDTEKIRTIVENLMMFRSKLSFASIHSRLIKPLTEFPDLGNISEILHQLNSPEMSIDKVAEIIERDFTTKAHLLSIANSAFVSPTHPISSTRSAVMLLGSSLVKAIYLTVQASRIADSRVCAKNALQTSFDYGLKLSLAIQKLALRKQMNSDLRECAIGSSGILVGETDTSR